MKKITKKKIVSHGEKNVYNIYSFILLSDRYIMIILFKTPPIFCFTLQIIKVSIESNVQ